MFVIHYGDETNHFAEKDTTYLVDIMRAMYAAMLEEFLCDMHIFWCYAEFLKKVSNFNVIPIHLSESMSECEIFCAM